MVERVGDVQVSKSIYGDAPGGVQQSRCGRAPIAAIAGRADSFAVHESDHRRHGACRGRDLANNVVHAVCNVEVPGAVQGNAGGSVQRRACRQTAVAGVRRVPVAGNGRDQPGLRGRADGSGNGCANAAADHADAMVIDVGDVEVPKTVERDTGGLIEFGHLRRNAVKNGNGFAFPVAGNGNDVPRHEYSKTPRADALNPCCAEDGLLVSIHQNHSPGAEPRRRRSEGDRHRAVAGEAR